MKKLFSLLLVAALLIGLLAACGEQKAAPTGGESGEGSGLIGVCMQNMSSSIAELESAALTETFEALGYEVQVVSADDSVSNQVQQIQNFILMDAEMLVVLPCEIETLEDTLLEAREAGIKVVISGGTGTISEDAYDAVSADDEYMIGMYVASVAKTWVEEHMDADGDWHVAFLSSTISDDAKSRCAGEAQILEPWLKNEAGEYVNLMGEVVSEAERIENPVYCEMIAERVTNLADCTTEMDISGDNRSVAAGVLTDDPNVRVIIAYNSLVSTAGSQYIMDTYPENEQDEFAFFSGGVMGDEYEYLIGAVSETSGTKSVFRGACQFGGGDAAATLANLAYNVMFGEAGVDYGKSNPNSIGLYFPIDAEQNGSNAALVCFDTSPYIESFTELAPAPPPPVPPDAPPPPPLGELMLRPPKGVDAPHFEPPMLPVKGTDKRAWLNWDGERAHISGIDDYVLNHRRRMKPCTSFDKLSRDSGENEEFSPPEQNLRHFSRDVAEALSEMSAEYPEAKALAAEYARDIAQPGLEDIVRLIDPYSYIGQPGSKQARSLRIRVGARDADTSPMIGLTLALSLSAAGIDTDYALVWDQPHSEADYPGEVCDWIDSLSK